MIGRAGSEARKYRPGAPEIRSSIADVTAARTPNYTSSIAEDDLNFRHGEAARNLAAATTWSREASP